MNAQQNYRRLRRGQRRGAFTLIEIMIVIAITALVASIAIPYFITYRNGAQTKACVANLRSLMYAKEQWAMEAKKNIGDPCALTDLVGLQNYIKNSVTCPTGTGYVVGDVGAVPTCTSGITDHFLP
jgi:prepilin-type N-terminal cleavage/methylation domain-containing protein